MCSQTPIQRHLQLAPTKVCKHKLPIAQHADLPTPLYKATKVNKEWGYNGV